MRRLAAALALLAGLGGAAVARQVEVVVRGMRLDLATGAPVVSLVEKGAAGRELPIWIGPFEAQAIAMEMENVPSPPRPLTHDLMKQLIERLGGRLTSIEIADLRDGTYFATLHLGSGDRALTVDARPSDAIAIALRFHAPILVAEDLFAKAKAADRSPAAARLWGLTVQDLTPEIAALFEMPGASGVLVSDVSLDAPGQEVHRGDVITALDGAPVATVEELTTRADVHPASHDVQLSLRRGPRKLDVRFSPDPE